MLPHLYLLRSPELVICRYHTDLADEIATTVEELSVRPRSRPREWAREYADYLAALSSVGPLTSMRAGQLYRSPDLLAFEGTCISIVESNADLLRGGLDEWLPDVVVGLPMVADGRAVQESGTTPFYATTFDNVASQRLAARLGLSLIGAEFSLTYKTD
jgi:hypothetical protein